MKIHSYTLGRWKVLFQNTRSEHFFHSAFGEAFDLRRPKLLVQNTPFKEKADLLNHQSKVSTWTLKPGHFNWFSLCWLGIWDGFFNIWSFRCPFKVLGSFLTAIIWGKQTFLNDFKAISVTEQIIKMPHPKLKLHNNEAKTLSAPVSDRI